MLSPITSSNNTDVTWLNPLPLSVENLPSQWVCLPNSNYINYILHSYLNGPHNLDWLLYSSSLPLNYSQICFKWQLWYLGWSSCLFVSCTEISVSMRGRLIVLLVQMGFESMCDSSATATGHLLSASHQQWNPTLLEADQQCWFSQLFPSLSWKETVVSCSVKW